MPSKGLLSCMVLLAAIYVVDGDTIDIDGQRWRLLDFDTPETGRAKCQKELQLGLQATKRLQELISAGKKIETRSSGRRDRYGRVLGDLLIDGANPRERLIAEGLARHYTGRGRRPDWCAA